MVLRAIFIFIMTGDGVIKVIWLAVVLSVLSAQSYANEQKGKWEPGVSGTIAMLAGGAQSNSRLDSGPKNIDSLSGTGEDKMEAFFFPLAASHVNYTFANGNSRVQFGMQEADIALGRPHIELGYHQYVDSLGTFKFSYLPGILSATTWKDPYLVGENRSETDRNIQGVRFQYSDILSSRFGLEMAYGDQKIDDELSGISFSPTAQQALDRNGDLYFIELSHLDPISKTWLVRSSVNYMRKDLSGKAMSSNKYTGQVAFLKRLAKGTFTVSATYHYEDFENVNPIFQDTRSDNGVGIMSTYVYKAPFNLKNVGLVALLGYNQDFSNIDFYDNYNVSVGAGVSYDF